MKDGSDAVADWPILNALVNALNGASWVSFHHGDGVGMGKPAKSSSPTRLPAMHLVRSCIQSGWGC